MTMMPLSQVTGLGMKTIQLENDAPDISSSQKHHLDIHSAMSCCKSKTKAPLQYILPCCPLGEERRRHRHLSMREDRICVVIADGWASLSLKMLSTTEISVEVVSRPQKAHQSFTTIPAPTTSEPRFTVPACEQHQRTSENKSNSKTQQSHAKWLTDIPSAVCSGCSHLKLISR